MGWSTRELADLSGATVAAVRHYHHRGLLAEPERRVNGYKEYGVDHLVRVLQIRRLIELGFSLAQVAQMGEELEHPHEALRALDAELTATIERLQRARVELAALRRQEPSVDLPVQMPPTTYRLSDADRAYTVVMTRVLGPLGLGTWRDMLSEYRPDPADLEFEVLPAEADDEARHDLAARMVPFVRDLRARHPGLWDVVADAPRGPQVARKVLETARREIYNPAQLDVLRQMEHLVRADRDA